MRAGLRGSVPNVNPGINGGKFRLVEGGFCVLEREKAGFGKEGGPGRVPGDVL